MPKSSMVVGRHRNVELAHVHLEKLIRDNPAAEIELIARRNRSGRFSHRGQYFYFEITPRVTGESLQDFFDAYDIAEEFDSEQEYETSADYYLAQ